VRHPKTTPTSRLTNTTLQRMLNESPKLEPEQERERARARERELEQERQSQSERPRSGYPAILYQA